jgi:hypothetical protein
MGSLLAGAFFITGIIAFIGSIVTLVMLIRSTGHVATVDGGVSGNPVRTPLMVSFIAAGLCFIFAYGLLLQSGTFIW